MKTKDIVHKYTFAKDERDKLRDIQAGITISEAQLDGLHIYRNVILTNVYKRLGIDGEPKTGYSKGIRYNLAENEIIHTETPIEKTKNVKE